MQRHLRNAHNRLTKQIEEQSSRGHDQIGLAACKTFASEPEFSGKHPKERAWTQRPGKASGEKYPELSACCTSADSALVFLEPAKKLKSVALLMDFSSKRQ